MLKKSLIIASFSLSFSNVISADPILLENNGHGFEIDPERLSLTWVHGESSSSLAEPSTSAYESSKLVTDEKSASWFEENQGLEIQCAVLENGFFELNVTALKPDSTFKWSTSSLQPEDSLIFARDSGILVSLNNEFWRNTLTEDPWNTLDQMSMPVWGVMQEEHLESWMISSPFRNEIEFVEKENSDQISINFSHHFAEISPEKSITIRVCVDQKASPITPGLRYREWLDETNSVTTLKSKAEVVPEIDRLAGAPHVYLWGDTIFTWLDIPAQKWKGFTEKLINESTQVGSIAEKFKEEFSNEEWSLVEECATAEWPHKYMKQQIANGISRTLETTGFHSESNDEIKRSQENADYLYQEYSDYLLPVKDWGNGASLKLLTKLKEMGFDHLKLCLPGWEIVEPRPWVAQTADENGWLFGTYDSYHSIHNPTAAETSLTWITAQMTQELWDNGGMMRKDGTFLHGFKGIGKKLNPLYGRDFYESRIEENLTNIPFNYYFMDCDAYGEVYDDFHPMHSYSMEEDAAERTRRLKWLADEKGLVVGSEGGNVYALEGVHILEGIFGPYFGWDDSDLTNKDSKYYRGRYYPADEPEVNFKPIPMKEKYRQLYYDPSVRIPLFQAAFHDAVMTTHHWSNDRFKYPELTKTVELYEMLWMCPPMVHLNYTTLKERGSSLKEYYDKWSPLNEKLAFARLKCFKYLSDDKLVQETEWEDGTRIIVNFGQEDFVHENKTIQPMDSLVIPKPFDQKNDAPKQSLK